MPAKSKTTLLLTFDVEHCSADSLVHLLKDPRTDGRLLDRITKLHHENTVLMELLLIHPRVAPQTLLYLYHQASDRFKKRILELKKSQPVAISTALVPITEQTEGPSPVEERAYRPGHPAEDQTLYQRIQTMTVAEKIQFALRAGKDARALLLKDPNRQVSMTVLSSPKITEDEILTIAQSRNVSDEILRTVAKNKDWMKNYKILFALIGNPKTSIGVSISLLSLVKVKDLGLLAKNRNLPEALRTAANRLLTLKHRQS